MDKRYQNQKILIFGLGLNMGGVGSAKFFASQAAQVRVTDLKNQDELKSSLNALKDYPQIEYILGEHRYEDFDWADLIIKNPAIKPDNQYLKYAKQKDKKIEMDMGIFLNYINPQQVIGVTGTKGKSTTASLIYEVLSKCHSGERSYTRISTEDAGQANMTAKPQNDREVVFAGNIGISVLDSLPLIKPNSRVILELSSFQLESWGEHEVSPHIGVITNIFPDHLNYYQSIDDYIEAKKLISLNQTPDDLLFLLKRDFVTSGPEFLTGIKSQIIYFSKSDLPTDFKPKLLGEHNLNNMAAALKVVDSLGIDKSRALEIMKNFSGVEFRMELIKEWHGVTVYNDTTATNPNSSTYALKSFPNSILITGGLDAGLSYQDFAQTIDQLAKAVYFLEGSATDQIKSFLQNKNKIKGEYNNFDDLLKDLKPNLKPEDVVLFSPAAKSFNLFQNEFDRGRKFNQAITKILSD